MLQNNRDIPVNIFKGEKLIAECLTIQEAASCLKEETNAERKNWSVINNGIWCDESYSINGATYYFTTAEESIKNKKLR